MTPNEQRYAFIALLRVCNGLHALHNAVDAADTHTTLRACEAVTAAIQDLQTVVRGREVQA